MSILFERRPALLIMFALLTIGLGCSGDSVSPAPEPVDPALVMGIAYYDGTNLDLKYVEKTGEFWGKPEVVHYEGNVGQYLSLALDAQGNPHISYYKNDAHDLMYAVRGEDGWRRSTVTAYGDVGSNTSLALDPQGTPHIAYQHRNAIEGDRIMYASYVSEGNWMIEEVTGSRPTGVLMLCRTEYGFPISLAIDAAGAPHITWVTAGPDLDFAYATKPDGGAWEITIIDDTDNVGYVSSIALDAQGNPHISYVEGGSPDQLMYARKIGDDPWQKETVTVSDPSDNCRYPTSIALDASGTPHISYYNDNNNLGYAMKSAGGEWVYEVADGQGDVGRYCSLVIDPGGTPCISYWDYAEKDLKCAVRYENGWGRVVIDEAGKVGMYTSLAMAYR